MYTYDVKRAAFITTDFLLKTIIMKNWSTATKYLLLYIYKKKETQNHNVSSNRNKLNLNCKIKNYNSE